MKTEILITLIAAFLMTAMFFMFSANSALADPQIQVSSTVSPTPIAPGTDGYVQLTFTNTGTSPASSIQIIGIYPDPNLIVSYSVIGNLGSLGNGQSTTALVKFSVSNTASSGLYNIRFQINYCTSTCTEVDPTVIVTVQSSSSLTVASIQPDILAAGETTTLNFNLVNQGKDSINNIILTWSTPNNEILPLGTSNRQFIASLAGGSSLILPINISVSSSVSPGVYPLTIQLSYFDKSGVKQNFSSSIGMKIGGTTDFDVGVQQYSAGTVSLSIANIGVNPATSVSVSIPQQNNFAVTGTNSVFLGNLNSGDFSVANFQITSSGFARSSNVSRNINETSNILTMQISYSDTSGARQIVQKQITLNLAATQSTENAQRNRFLGLTTTLWIEIVIVIIIAGVLLWYFKFRKKKNFLSQLSERISGKSSK